MRKQHKIEDGYPFEPWIEWIVARHFESQGHLVDALKSQRTDLLCVHSGNDVNWLIEVKGEASSDSTDFHTGIGQLVHRVRNQTDYLGLAVPQKGKYVGYCAEVAQWLRQALNLHWIIVDETGALTIIAPDDTRSSFRHPSVATDLAKGSH